MSTMMIDDVLLGLIGNVTIAGNRNFAFMNRSLYGITMTHAYPVRMSFGQAQDVSLSGVIGPRGWSL